MISTQELDTLDAQQMRAMLARLQAEVLHKQALIDKLTHENAVLKRLKFAAQSERFNAEQRELLDENLDADMEAVSREIEALQPTASAPKRQPKRAPLPARLPRREIRHEPENTTCACGC